MSDTSGLSSRTPLAFYDPDSFSWRTSQGTFLSDSMSWSLTWPTSGMTQNGVLYALPTLGPAINGPGFSSLPTPRVASDRTSRSALTREGHWSAPSLAQALELARGILPRECDSWEEVQGWQGLPTPTAGDAKGARNATAQRRDSDSDSEHHSGTTLTDWALLRTPQASVTEPKPGIKLEGRTPSDPQVGLIDQVLALLPTPTTQPMTGNGHARTLGKEVALLPTPLTSMANGAKAHGDGGPGLREVIELGLTGEPTDLPSSDTPPCSDDPHPTLWTSEDD